MNVQILETAKPMNFIVPWFLDPDGNNLSLAQFEAG
jgi:hypothetical protein